MTDPILEVRWEDDATALDDGINAPTRRGNSLAW